MLSLDEAASTVDIFYVWPIADTLSMLHDLPLEVLDIVLRQVGARSLCRLACVSKGMLRAVEGAPLRVTLRPGQGSVARRWLLSPGVQRRVVVLCVRRGSLPHSFVYPTLKNLRVLDVAFSFVPPRLLDAFARVATLRTLRIHRLGTMGSGVFSTRAFEALVVLEELALTFRPESWAVVCVGPLPASLRKLSIRHAPAMLVDQALNVPVVLLDAFLTLEFLVPMGPGATDVSLECAEEPIQLSKAVDAGSRPRSLRVKCPGNLSLADLACVCPSLRAVKMVSEVLFVSAAEFGALEEVELDATVGLGIRKSGPLPPSLVALRATLGGVAYDLRGAIERFRQPA